MGRYVDAGLIVLGIVMTAYGLDSAPQSNPRAAALLLRRPLDDSGWLLVGGILAVLMGVSLLAIRRLRAG